MKQIFPKLVVSLFVIMLVVTLALVVIWLRRNTSFLGGTTAEQVTQNNLNFAGSEDILQGFTTQELIVPEQFKTGVLADKRIFNLPPKFKISVFANELVAPRFFSFDDSNNMYVAEKDGKRVSVLPDANADGVADTRITIDSGLTSPHSVVYYKGDLYVGEETRVVVYRGITPDGKYSAKQTLVGELPEGGHITRTVVVGPDEMLYVSIGSSCNLCKEEDDRRATVMRYELDGTLDGVFASGLRNSVGITFHNNELWSVDNGRDNLGDDLPPEEVNVLEAGKDYGWPYCYGSQNANPEFADSAEYCKKETQSPRYEMQAHSAPLGLVFGPSLSSNFPVELNSNLFVAFHGSWNRSVATGYKLVRINTAKPDAKPVDFVTGWLDSSGNVWGRPVGVGFDSKGVMYISDDKAGLIYRVIYSNDQVTQ